jgi:hypothetical protein
MIRSRNCGPICCCHLLLQQQQSDREQHAHFSNKTEVFQQVLGNLTLNTKGIFDVRGAHAPAHAETY